MGPLPPVDPVVRERRRRRRGRGEPDDYDETIEIDMVLSSQQRSNNLYQNCFRDISVCNITYKFIN